MSTAVCPSCGTPHGPAQRYCLACGALVGRRPVEIDQAIAFRHERDAAHAAAPASPATTAPFAATTPATGEPTPPSATDVSVWRRPVTSIATALALAAGITVGFLTAPQGGVADGRAPVAASGQAGAATTPPTATTPTDDTPTADAPTADATEPADAADGEQAPADDVAAPGPGDAAPAAPDAPVASPAPAAPAPAPAKPKTTTKASSAKRGTATPSKSTLPKVDHVWVIGVGTPVTARDGGYLGETLLERGTELPKYAPVSTDPLIGAAALVAGREPSANAKTIATLLAADERSWRAYAPTTPSCADATGGIPLLAFPTVTSTADCDDHVADLAALSGDLGSPPALSYVATDPTLDADGLDAQLRQVVEPIRRSAAFKRAGLIAIVPTSADPIRTTGALILSPFAEGSTAVGTAYGPYALLRTFADLLGVKRPGHAADADVRALGPDVLRPQR